MITFNDYLKQFSKKFVCLEFDKATNQALYKFAIDNGFDLSIKYDGTKQDPKDFKFHTTVFYTTTEHNISDAEIEVNLVLKAKKFELLGKDHDVPVIKLNVNDQLKQIRDILKKQGFRDAWPTYKPHVSLSYKKNKYDLSDLELPRFDFIVTKLTIENQ